MKKKEYEVWLIKSETTNEDEAPYSIVRNPKFYMNELVKAKLIIEVPEEKIEITRTQFISIWNKHLDKPGYCNCNGIIEEFFGKDEDK